MFRTPTAALTVALVALGVSVTFSWIGSTRWEEAHRDRADLARRLEVLETVYDSSECILTSEEEGGCEVGQGFMIFLGTPDRDGEVRWLRLRDSEGKETRMGQLGTEVSYVRTRGDEGLVEAFISDADEGLIEVYAARPGLASEGREERLPILIKHILPE